MSPQPKLWLMADLPLASLENGLSLTDTEMKNDPGTSNIDSQCILELKDVTLRFGGVVALKNVTMDVRNNEILALIGPNGAGKSCILNCISGFTTPQAGTILFRGQSLMNQPSHRRSSSGIGRTFQGVKLLPDMSVEDNILVGRHSLMRTNIFQDFAYWPYAARNRRKHKQDIREILELLDLEQYTDTPVSSLSYGLRKKIDLGRALATEPQISHSPGCTTNHPGVEQGRCPGRSPRGSQGGQRFLGRRNLRHAGQVNYSAAKAGITGLTMTLAKEWGAHVHHGELRGVWPHKDPRC